jgi:hypothetical protein
MIQQRVTDWLRGHSARTHAFPAACRHLHTGAMMADETRPHRRDAQQRPQGSVKISP